jgi:hypothetical protein
MSAPSKPSPLLPETFEMHPKVDVESLFTLFYIHGNTPKVQHLNFSFKGPFKDAIQRGRNFCTRVNYRFISVRPFLTSLEDLEQRAGGETQL